ncbi:MAG: serine hydrolase [Acidobacteriota bacterium]
MRLDTPARRPLPFSSRSSGRRPSPGFVPVRRLVIALLLAAAAASAASAASAGGADAAPQLAGTWKGTIEIPTSPLEVIVRLTRGDDGAWSGSIDIPAQGARGLPLEGIDIGGDAAAFTITDVPGVPTFRGTVEGDSGTLTGSFTQGMLDVPFRLERSAAGDRLAGFDGVVEAARTAWGVPGVAVAVVDGGNVLLAKGYGLRDVEANLPVTPQTLFAIGSSSKAFTALSVAQLVDDGRVLWDEPVRTYLPSFTLADEMASARMTPRDLLCHRSGLPRHDLMWYGSPAARRELFDRLRHLEPTAGFRERFQYQNLMFMTAGLLVGQVAGGTWEGEVQRRIFDPLGMTHSNFSVDAMAAAPDRSLAYVERDDGGVKRVETTPYRALEAVGPAGSINSNLDDMIRWLASLLAGGAVPGSEGERLVSADTFGQLIRPQMTAAGSVMAARLTQPELPDLAYGLGWMIQTYRGHRMVHHGGNIDGFSALVAFLPDDGFGVVVLSNLGGNQVPTAVAWSAFDRLLGLDPVDWSDRLLTQRRQLEAAQEGADRSAALDRRRDTEPSRPAAEFAGVFRHPGYGDLEVSTPDGTTLKASYHGFTSVLEHWHFDVWRAKDDPVVGLKLAFHDNPQGDIDRLEVLLEPTAPVVVFHRAPPEGLSEPATLARLAGDYTFTGTVMTISVVGNRLRLTVPGQPATYLVPNSSRAGEARFDINGLQGFGVRFRWPPEAEDAVPEEMLLVQPNGVFVAARVEG